MNFYGQDILKVDWPQMAAEKGGHLSLIGNLPYNITSQILFSFLDNYKAVRVAVVTAQYEVLLLPYIDLKYKAISIGRSSYRCETIN